jgi:hypothetical protein
MYADQQSHDPPGMSRKPLPLQGGRIPGHLVLEVVPGAVQVPRKDERYSSGSPDLLESASVPTAIRQVTPTSGLSVIRMRPSPEMVSSRVLEPRVRRKPLMWWRCAAPRVSNNVTSSNWARSMVAIDSRSSGDNSAVQGTALAPPSPSTAAPTELAATTTASTRRRSPFPSRVPRVGGWYRAG